MLRQGLMLAVTEDLEREVSCMGSWRGGGLIEAGPERENAMVEVLM